MIDKVVSKQELIDAQKDAKTLEDVINGEVGQLIKTRLGRMVYTLASIPMINTMPRSEISSLLDQKTDKTYVDASLTAIAGGHKAYATLAAALANTSTFLQNSIVEITNDSDSSKNGTYQWNGADLTKSAYDPLTQAKADATTKANAAKNDANSFTKSIIGKATKNIEQDAPTLNYYVQRDGYVGAMAGYQQTKFKITAGKKYRLTGTITSPPLPNPAWTTFGLYIQSKASSISEANRLIDTLVTASASTVQGSTMHNIDINIDAVAEAQYLIVSQKSTDSLSLYEYYELEPRLNNIDAQLPQIGTNNNRLGVIETDIKNKAAVLSPYVTNGQYLNYVGTANVNTDYELHRYDVLEGDFIFIDGQFTAPLSPSSTKIIGYCGFYTTTSMGSLIAGSLTQQAENSTKSYAVSYIVPPGAKYLNISVKRGTDVTVVKRSPNMASIANRFPNVITLWGDSITWGSAPEDGVTWAQRLQTRIGKRATVLNCGIGGDSIWQISARSGAIPFVNTVDFVLPALASETVQVGSMVNYSYNNFFKSSYDLTKNVYLLIQGETGRYETIKTINPVYVDGIECTLSINKISDGNYDWFLKRNVDAVAPRTIYAHTPFYTNGAKNIKSIASVFWMGTNESFNNGVIDVDVYVDVLKRNIAYQGVSRYVVIGVYGGTGISGMSVAQLEAMEERMLKEFGSHYINMRKYVTTNALSDAGITPTAADTTAIGQGKCPPSLMADGLHPNAALCELISRKVFACLEMQGGIYTS